ncbi:alpha/beta hydrolase [Mycobacterium sp. Root135]|uniref:alpha/beta fold hydrolase n=1 Tax=Mycobacterium sp. Root135 TaxID=1736457 RepID=UPI0006FD1CF6|nr:alpha/beta hydrolase [Mycobacterium sp. Root135]KQY07830.1 alpha/beta hydrolase [Mycobacterium sp. Root135]
MSARIEPVTGHYLHVEIDGVEQRIYFEEAGSGIPLLCLHTAGSDGRQYRHLLNDKTVTDRFRVITFDMPWHGKSSPAPGWRDTEYQLTAATYSAMILAFVDALDLQQPALMGCSIGGRIVLKLAREAPERFRALIGLQSGPHVAPYYDREYLHRPDIHGGELCAALMSGLIGPHVPAVDRDETLWHYSQGGPGVFKGDLHYYKDDGDRDSDLAAIDVRKCPLYFLTGEYDYSCMPEDTLYLEKMIPGTKAVIMTGLGHFPMSEDHERFMTYLHPVLDAIEAAGPTPVGP